MWECKACRRLLENEDESCWSCNGLREQVELVTSPTVEPQVLEDIEESYDYTWECAVCRRLLEDQDQTCWSCGEARHDVALVKE